MLGIELVHSFWPPLDTVVEGHGMAWHGSCMRMTGVDSDRTYLFSRQV